VGTLYSPSAIVRENRSLSKNKEEALRTMHPLFGCEGRGVESGPCWQPTERNLVTLVVSHPGTQAGLTGQGEAEPARRMEWQRRARTELVKPCGQPKAESGWCNNVMPAVIQTKV
jgi:hypothetical protein